MAVYYFGMDVRVQFGDLRLKSSQDIRGADFVSKELTKEQTYRSQINISQKPITSVLPKNEITMGFPHNSMWQNVPRIIPLIKQGHCHNCEQAAPQYSIGSLF